MRKTTLSLRQLNRASLARQWLLERVAASPLEAIEHLAGLQAQLVVPPFVGLWTRLLGFEKEALLALFHRRQVVRATMMRATLHLVSAADYLCWQPALRPVLSRSLQSFFPRGQDPAIQAAVLEAARALLQEEPSTFALLRQRLAERFPELEPAFIAYLVRMGLPLVQVPDQAQAWGFDSNPRYALAFDWLRQKDEPWSAEEGRRLLVRRYLAAFGPASLKDLQTWSGLTGLAPIVRSLGSDLRSYRDEQGQELWDLPEQPLPPEDFPAPVRFLPSFDNLLIAYARRERIIPATYRRAVFLSAGRVAATILIDGFVAGTWTVRRQGDRLKLLIAPWTSLPGTQRQELLQEAERLLTFLAAGGEARRAEIQIEAP
ncbi:winged helix DNA-binding domain-containing protein [Thermogemmatispora sp.]|uniref:winged helix DNA-binding domain-containing protein n=1 Tax=Thermogemmatispora sp. TaxID=1968838 RepID=UPI0035E40E2D